VDDFVLAQDSAADNSLESYLLRSRWLWIGSIQIFADDSDESVWELYSAAALAIYPEKLSRMRSKAFRAAGRPALRPCL